MIVFLSYGMGVDSTAYLLRCLLEPACRDFQLEELVVLTAQTGSEFRDTKRLVEQHIFPRLRAHHVRFVEVARAGQLEGAGIVYLNDTRQPFELHLSGHYRLVEELLTVGTVPQFANGQRRCSQKYKGFVLDTAKVQIAGEGASWRQIIGFNADEPGRIARDQSYSTPDIKSEYPLAEWGWGREQCEKYIEGLVGEKWKKSCCSFCPFAGGKAPMLERYHQFPQAGGEALYLEHIARSLNGRITLYSGGSVFDAIEASENRAAFEQYENLLHHSKWGLYQVRRIYYKKGKADRSVKLLERGTAPAMQEALELEARKRQPQARLSFERLGSTRVIPKLLIREPQAGVYPTIEETLVVCPAVVQDKQRHNFEKSLVKAENRQLTLF
jgi:hypothetical protein